MRNRNDIGNVHFDESTRELIVEKKLNVVCRGTLVKLVVQIPLTIKRALRQEHYDQAEDLMIRNYDQHFNRCVCNEIWNLEEIEFKVRALLLVDVCEHLYSQFIREQAKAGNQVWATPETMQKIGPKPEEDPRYEGMEIQ